jgi:hypothetical protein
MVVDLGVLDRVLNRIGIAAHSISRLRLGHGLSGNMTTIVTVTIIGAVAIAFAVKVWIIQAACLAIAAAMGFYGLSRVEWIGRERPEVALLEGAELILWQRHQLEIQAKNIPTPPQEPAKPFQAPAVSPPAEQIAHVETEKIDAAEKK